MPIIEVELKSGTYPASTEDTRVARCYVCNAIADKKGMFCVGPGVQSPAVEESLLYIYRCKDCGAGSEKWLRHFVGRSALRPLYMGLEGKTVNAELAAAVGKQIVENVKEGHERAICDRLDTKRGLPVDVKTIKTLADDGKGRDNLPSPTPVGRGTTPAQDERKVNDGRKKRSWRTVAIRRGR